MGGRAWSWVVVPGRTHGLSSTRKTRSATSALGQYGASLGVGWLTGLEPATTGITIRDSTS